MNFKYNKHILYLIVFYVTLNYYYTYFTFEDLLILIKPVNIIFSFFVKSIPEYDIGIGFHYPNIDILINKSCSGFQFFLTTYIITYLLILKNETSIYIIRLNFLVSLILSYLFTIYFNSARFVISFLSQNTANYFLTKKPHFLIHEVTGQIVYFISYIIIIYLIIQYYKRKSK